jgi:hypothetical protein
MTNLETDNNSTDLKGNFIEHSTGLKNHSTDIGKNSTDIHGRLILNSNNYFSNQANKDYLSVSQYKDFISCEARTMARLAEEYTQKSSSDALLFGSLLHKWNEGEVEFKEFLDSHPELFSTKGATKGQLKSTFNKVFDLIHRINNDPYILKALQGAKEQIFTAELFGIWWKVCIDSYNPNAGYFSDLKSMAEIYSKFYSVEKKAYVNFIEYYKYDLQMVVYSEIEKLATNRKENLNPLLVVVTKESPPDAAIFKGFLDFKDDILQDVGLNVARILDLKNGLVKPIQCGRCEYCRTVKKTPIFIYKQFKEETL